MPCLVDNATGHWACTTDPETWTEFATRLIGITALCITMLGGFTFGCCLIGSFICHLCGIQSTPKQVELAPHSDTRKVPASNSV